MKTVKFSIAIILALVCTLPLHSQQLVGNVPISGSACTNGQTYVYVVASGTFVCSTVSGLPPGTGVVRVNSGVGAVAELSGDATTSGSNAVTVVKVNGAAVPTSQTAVGTNNLGQFVATSVPVGQPNNIYVSPACPTGSTATCYQAYADVQVATTATYTPPVSGATSLSPTANDQGGQWQVIPTAGPLVSLMTVTDGTSTNNRSLAGVLAAWQSSGTPSVGTCWYTNEASGTSTTVTASVTPTGGAGHSLVAFVRSFGTTQTYTFSDNSGSGQSWANILGSSVVFGGNSVQMAATYGAAGVLASGSYTVTATINPTKTYRSLTVCETVNAQTLDAAEAYAYVAEYTGSLIHAGGGWVSVTTNPITTTSANDLAIFFATANSAIYTWNAQGMGITALQITTQSTDPPFAASDVGKKFLGTTNCNSINGYISCGTVFPPGTISSFTDAHHVSVSVPPWMPYVPTGNAFTGWFLWGHDDTTVLRSAWSALVTANSANSPMSLYLPCGAMFVSAAPFVTTSLGGAYNRNLVGCKGQGTFIVPTADFSYAGASGGLLYSDPNSNWSGFSTNAYQNASIFTYISDLTFWGAGQDGSLVTTALPIMNLSNTMLDNVWVAAWNYNANVSMPAMSGAGIELRRSGSWSGGSRGLVITGDQVPTRLFNSASDCFFGVGGQYTTAGYGLEIDGGHLTSSNCQWNPQIGGSAYGAYVHGGWWNSSGDSYGKLLMDGGTATLSSSIDELLTVYGISQSGGRLSVSNSQLDKLILSSTAVFVDGGGNYTCQTIGFNPCTGTTYPWTSNYHAVNAATGGSLVPWKSVGGSCTGVATASQTLGLYGTGPNVTASACTSTTIGTGIPMQQSGYLTFLQATATTGGVGASSGVVTVLKNGSATAVTCTLGTGTSCYDFTHSVAFAVGDLISLQFTTQGSDTLAGVNASVATY